MTFPLDRLHLGVRLLTLLGWLVAWAALSVVGLWLAELVLGSAPAWLWLIWVVLALFLTQWPSRWLEAWLVVRWPSRRTLTIEGQVWTLSDNGTAHTLNLAQPHQMQVWHFAIKQNRGASQRKGHVVLALRLAQARTAITVFTIAPPESAAELVAAHAFFDLRQTPDPAPAAVARHREHLAAESDRYNSGHEIALLDFRAVLAALPAGL